MFGEFHKIWPSAVFGISILGLVWSDNHFHGTMSPTSKKLGGMVICLNDNHSPGPVKRQNKSLDFTGVVNLAPASAEEMKEYSDL